MAKDVVNQVTQIIPTPSWIFFYNTKKSLVIDLPKANYLSPGLNSIGNYSLPPRSA